MTADQVIARRRLVEAASLDPARLPTGRLVVASAEGCWLNAADGRRVFDASAGSGVVNLGHGFSPVVEACEAQLRQLVHVGWNLGHDLRPRLCEALADLLPFDDGAVLFTVTGAEAIEAALKVAMAATGREWVVAFRHGYHGKTAGALAVTWNQEFRRFSPLPSGRTEFAAAPGIAGPDGNGAIGVDEAVALLRHLLHSRAVPPAAVVIEPVQGAEGIHPVPDEFLAAVIREAHEVASLVIYDEIYTGFGRCGLPFVASVPGLRPDVMAIGKALGNGLPISAVVGPRPLLDALPSGTHSSTFAGHPVSCAAGLAVVASMQSLQLWHDAERWGGCLREALDALRRDVPRIGPVRGRGLMLAFDCVDSDGIPDPKSARRFLEAAVCGGVLARGGGVSGATVKLTPPLLMSDADFSALCGTLSDVAQSVLARPASVRQHAVAPAR